MPDIQITVKDGDGLVTLDLPDSPKVVRGMNLLVQIVVLKILKNFNRDVFDPAEGTNFRDDIGKFNFSFGDFDEVRLNVVTKIQKIEQDIIEEQGTNIGSPDERLRKLRLLDVAADPGTGSLAVRVQILNESGNTRDVVV